MRALILGNGGHAMALRDALWHMGYDEFRVFEDCGEPLDSFWRHRAFSDVVFVAIGDNALRLSYVDKAMRCGFRLPPVIHPFCFVSPTALVGEGCALMAGCVVGAGARLERGVIVNTCASVDHGCEIGEGAHIAVGAHVAGEVSIGELTLIGAGAVVIDHLSIGRNCTVGAGAAVVRNLPPNQTYAGVPARQLTL